MAGRQIQIIKFNTIYEIGRGNLTAIETMIDVPFEIRRVFYITEIPALDINGDSVIRGRHAHKVCQQVIICVKGSCSVFVDGNEYVLDNPSTGLYVPPSFTASMTYFETDSIVLVLASEKYDKDDYIYSLSAPVSARA